MGQSWPEGHSLPASVLNHRPWRALSGSNWCVNSRGRVMMAMTRTRMTIICQALGRALFQLYYPLHPPMRGIVWPPLFFAGDKERHLSQRWKCQDLIAGKWQSWWVNTGLLTSKSHTLLGSLITWRPFPFRNELCCPASRIGLHSVPCRWLEPHIHAGWFTLYLRSHVFLFLGWWLHTIALCFAPVPCGPLRISSEGSFPLRVSSTTFAHAKHLFITVRPFCLIASLQDPGPRFTFIYILTSAKWFPGHLHSNHEPPDDEIRILRSGL